MFLNGRHNIFSYLILQHFGFVIPFNVNFLEKEPLFSGKSQKYTEFLDLFVFHVLIFFHEICFLYCFLIVIMNYGYLLEIEEFNNDAMPKMWLYYI